MSITKDQILAKLKSVETSIETLKTKEPHVYATRNKYLTGIGAIHEMDNMTQLVNANKFVNSHINTFDENAKELGITEEEFDETSKIQGIDTKVWKLDIEARVQELRDEQSLIKLRKAKKLLVKNLSEADIFARDMESIESLLITGTGTEDKV